MKQQAGEAFHLRTKLVPINQLDKQVEVGKVAWSGQASALASDGFEMCWLHLSRACVLTQPWSFQPSSHTSLMVNCSTEPQITRFALHLGVLWAGRVVKV